MFDRFRRLDLLHGAYPAIMHMLREQGVPSTTVLKVKSWEQGYWEYVRFSRRIESTTGLPAMPQEIAEVMWFPGDVNENDPNFRSAIHLSIRYDTVQGDGFIAAVVNGTNRNEVSVIIGDNGDKLGLILQRVRVLIESARLQHAQSTHTATD